ncbi:hypothetical protein [Paractinoplanes deccanensis]|nr:hypothetical protein [Actinoplanes deccanensis]
MVVFGGPVDTQRVGRDDVQPAQDRSKVMFERLARVADRIAETAKDGARINDQMVGRAPGAVHRAACWRRLAVAEEAASRGISQS